MDGEDAGRAYERAVEAFGRNGFLDELSAAHHFYATHELVALARREHILMSPKPRTRRSPTRRSRVSCERYMLLSDRA